MHLTYLALLPLTLALPQGMLHPGTLPPVAPWPPPINPVDVEPHDDWLVIPRHAAEIDCMKPAFQFFNLTYQAHVVFSTPSHLAISFAQLFFGISNPIAYDAICGAQSGGGATSDKGVFFTHAKVTECQTQAGVVGVTGKTTFSYLGFARSLAINQTWTCGGKGYAASTTVTIDPKCSTKVWQNPNFHLPSPNGEWYRTEDVYCDPYNFTLDHAEFASIAKVAESEV